MSQHTEALVWLAICGLGIAFGSANFLNALDVMGVQVARHVNGLRSLIVRNHVLTAALRLVELVCLAAIALPVVTPLRWATWIPEVLLFIAVSCIALASIWDWHVRRLVVSGRVHE